MAQGHNHRRRWTRFAGGAVFVLAVVVGTSYAASNRETKTLDPATRAILGGDYVDLPGGVTHYEITGPPGGIPVVLVHGSTIPMFNWDKQVGPFAAAGLRVLRYDAFGRGRSDRPPVDYDRKLYVKQLGDLLDRMELTDPLYLVGHSLGGAIAAAFAAQYPDRVKGLVLISPVINSVSPRAPFVISSIPLVRNYITRVAMVNVLADRASAQFARGGMDGALYEEKFREQSRFHGFERSVISMFGTDAVGDYRPELAKVGRNGTRTLLIWGTEDPDISRESVDAVGDRIPSLDLQVMPGVGHCPNLEASEEVNKRIVDFVTEE